MGGGGGGGFFGGACGVSWLQDKICFAWFCLVVIISMARRRLKDLRDES